MAGTNLWKNLPEFMKNNRFFFKDLTKDEAMEEVTPEHANLVSSHLFTDEAGVEVHQPVLDLDMDAKLVPSTTNGHHHLFINKPMSKDKYDKLLRVLNEVGILQDGIIQKQWEKDGVTCARLPGVKKQTFDNSSGGVIVGSQFPTQTKTYGTPEEQLEEATFKEKLGLINPVNTPIKVTANKPTEGFAPGGNITPGGGNVTLAGNYAPNVSKINEIAALEGLTGDLKTATLVFNNLVDQAAKAGFSMQEMVNAYQQFAGMDNDPNLIPKNPPPVKKKIEWQPAKNKLSEYGLDDTQF